MLYETLWNKPKVTFEENQIRELWGVWLKQNLEPKPLSLSAPITLQDKIKFDTENANYAKKIRKSFDAFIKKIKEEFNQDILIKNPSFYIKRGLQWRSIEDLNKAVELSGAFSFAAYYGKARLYTEELTQLVMDEEGEYSRSGNSWNLASSARKDTQTTGSKDTRVSIIEGAIANLYFTKQVLNETMIPFQRGFIGLTDLSTPEQKTSELVQKIERTIDLYEAFIKHIDNTISILKQSGNQNVALKYLSFKDKVGGSSDDEEKLELKSLGISNLFDASLYPLEEVEEDWFSSIFVAITGIFQIFVGAVLTIGSGGLLAKFGIGIIASGVSDIITSIRSLIEGQNIDMSSWLEGKGITYLINVITIGIDTLIDKIVIKFPETKNFFNFIRGKELGINQQQAKQTITATQIIKEVAKDQLITEGISSLIQLWGSSALKASKEEIESSTRKKISDLLSQYQKEMQKIFAEQKFNNNINTQEALIQSAMRFLKDYEKIYQTYGRKLASGVAKGVFRKEISYAITAAETAQSVKKISDTTNNFCNAFGQTIKYTAANTKLSGAMLKESLLTKRSGYNLIFTSDNVNHIMQTLQ